MDAGKDDNTPRTVNAYGEDAKYYNLPYFKPMTYMKPPAQAPILPTVIPEACVSKIIVGAVTGSVFGYLLGIFLGAMSDVAPINIAHGREVPQPPVREQFRQMVKATAAKSSGWAKNFGVLSAVFGGADCVIEKYRGKHDVWNPVMSGCAVGAAMSAKGGVGAACLGCAGFAGFSVVVDAIMGPH